MVQTTGSVASLLSQIYQGNSTSLNTSLSRISSGKRVQNASDDFVSYLKANKQNAYVTQYQTFTRNLQSGKAQADYMTAVGNSVVDQLSAMKDIALAYNATTDATEQAALTTKYTSALTALNATIANSSYDTSLTLYSNAAANVVNIAATIGSSAYNIQMNAGQMADNTQAAIGTLNAGTAAGLDLEIRNGQNYLIGTQVIADKITSQIKLNTSIISSLQGSISALTDVNEAEEMTNITNMQVRQQATASMMSQANSSAIAIARLFQ